MSPASSGSGLIGRHARAAERLAAEKPLETERRHRQVAAEEAAVERVQADRAVAGPAQPPDLRFDRHPRQRVIRVEPVVAEFALGDAGQHGEFGAHRVGAPARHVETGRERRTTRSRHRSRPGSSRGISGDRRRASKNDSHCTMMIGRHPARRPARLRGARPAMPRERPAPAAAPAARRGRSRYGRSASRTGRARRRRRTARRSGASRRSAPAAAPSSGSRANSQTAAAISADGGQRGERLRRPQRRLDDEQRQRQRHRRRSAAEHQPRPGKRQIKMRMGEDLRQLDISENTTGSRKVCRIV